MMEHRELFSSCRWGCCSVTQTDRTERPRRLNQARSKQAQGGQAIPPHSVPWAKAQYQKHRPVRPLSQHLDIRLIPNKKRLEGITVIEIQSDANSLTFFELEAADLNIKEVKIGGEIVYHRHDNSSLLVRPARPLKLGEKISVHISYEVSDPRAGIYFNLPDREFPNRATQVFTQGQDDDARYWFPCFDDPGTKFLFSLTVKAPAGFICTSNGKLIQEKRSEDEWEFSWKMSYPIPAYLVSLTAGDFCEIKQNWRNRPVHFLGEKGREKELELACGKTTDMLEFFSEKLGFEYPYEKYHQIFVSNFPFGGMENTTATTMTDYSLHPEEIEENYSSVDLVSHELAHQWFGDLVTCKTWTHGWLNESWATFMEYVYKERDKGLDETSYYRYSDLKIYLDEDREDYRRAIVTNVYSDPAEIWDRHLYQKGGLVLQMLRAEVGEEAFWRGTQIYLNRHAKGVVETVDFQRALEEASLRPLDWFFDQWIFKGGHPELKISFDWNEEKKQGKLQLEQKQKRDALTPLFRLRSHFEIFHANGEKEILPFDLSDEKATFVFSAISKPLAIRVDSENNLLKTLDSQLPEEMIFEQLQMSGDSVGKIWAMKALAKRPTRKAEAALVARLSSDPFWGVRAEAAHFLGVVRSSKAFEALSQALKVEADSRVRAGIAKALGNWRGKEALKILEEASLRETNIFSLAALIQSMGRTKEASALALILKFHNQTSWGDWILRHVYLGLKELDLPECVPVLMEGAQYGQSPWGRSYAVRCLGEVAKEKEDIDQFLVDLLRDRQTPIPKMAATALGLRGKSKYAGALDAAGFSAIEGHFKFLAHLEAQNLREQVRPFSEMQELQDDFVRLREENQKLKERLSILEQQYANHSNKDR